MALSWPEFLQQRAQGQGVQYFACAGATQTVMVCSHIWWTDQIALAFLQSGYNLVVHPPLYTFYTDEKAWLQFDVLWQQVLDNIEAAKVDFLLGGNSSAMLVHPGTGETVHAAASKRGRRVRLINWWWDEPRTRPPLARAGVGPAGFVKLLGEEHTINAIWDVDVKEELEAQLGLRNLNIHIPLGTLPEFWPHGYVSMEDRPLAACFLGHCHFNADWIENDADPLHGWAREIVVRKIAAPRVPMQQLIEDVSALHKLTMPYGELMGEHWRDADATADWGDADATADAADEAWRKFGRPMEVLNAAYMHYTRNKLVLAARKHLGGKLALIGKGWEKLGLQANMDHAREKSGVIYGQTQISLNLFGGCVHGGMPLRPYDIGASGGLIVTHDQRELADLFVPGEECLVFGSAEEMVEQMERVRREPAAFNAVAQAGRRRVLGEHTWGHRIRRLMGAVGD